jgi:hypothetical protein
MTNQVQLNSIICNGVNHEGETCGAAARVQRIDYEHGAILDVGSTDYRHILRETRYRIICPKCGPRLQVEKAE